MSKKVELNTVMKLFSIFVRKNWTTIDGYEDVLNRFGELVNALKSDEIELLIDLTERYEWVSYNDYHSSLRSMLKQLLTNCLMNKSRLFIFPIIKPSDEKNIKSGHAVMYMINSIKSSIIGFKNIEFVLLNEFNSLSSANLNMTENDYLLLVDDFIGTGNTLNKTLEKLNENHSIKNNFAILTIAIQDQAKVFLNKQNITCFSSFKLKKGISDQYNSPDLEIKHQIMKRIEDKIPDVRNYRNGYEKSEALITLIKTPNNTFPVFWKSLNIKGVEIEGPFQRH